MTTDWKALCSELLNALKNAIRVIYREDGTKHISTADAVIAKADAALAQPERVAPTDLRDETLLNEADACFLYGDGKYTASLEEVVAFARRMLLVGQRFAHPTLTPIPVSERLPGPDDCDAEGRCWWFWGEFWRFEVEGPGSPQWEKRQTYPCYWRNPTHWIAAHDLPLPTAALTSPIATGL
jgi:hypothetical protein